MRQRRLRAHIPNRLWHYRKRMGATQEEVARILGYHQWTDISHYEHGRKLPSLTTALKLELIYGVPVGFLFYDLREELRAQLRSRDRGRSERDHARRRDVGRPHAI